MAPLSLRYLSFVQTAEYKRFVAQYLPEIVYSCISFALLILRISPCITFSTCLFPLSPDPDNLCLFYPFAFSFAFIVLIPQWILSCWHLQLPV